MIKEQKVKMCSLKEIKTKAIPKLICVSVSFSTVYRGGKNFNT